MKTGTLGVVWVLIIEMQLVLLTFCVFGILYLSQVDYAQRTSTPPKEIVVGIVNGKATRHPKPRLSKEIIAAWVSGKVKVEIFINEEGKVLAAKAVSGNRILWPSAERAAMGARFSPINDLPPIKIKGYLVYNFSLPKTCIQQQIKSSF